MKTLFSEPAVSMYRLLLRRCRIIDLLSCLESNKRKALILFTAVVLILFPFCTKAQTCNYPDTLNTANHSGVTVTSGASGLFASVSSPANVIGSTSSFATLNSVIAGNAFVGVVKATPATKYPAGTFAGFNISNSSLLGLLSNITLATYSGGVLQESVSGSSVIIFSGLLSGSNNYNIGFKATLPFDEIRISLGGVLASVNVYYAFVEKFCAGPSLACNRLTTVTAPAFPVTVAQDQTAILGVGSVNNADYVIDTIGSNAAAINTAVGVATGGSIAVKDNVTTYAAGTFAAFDISSTSLLAVNVLSNITISTYNADTLCESITGASLVTANPSLLSASNGRTIVGFKTTKIFNEVKITVSNTLGLAYTVNVYGLLLESFCPGNTLACNTPTAAVNPALPVYVDGANTGINSIATVGGSISNALNAIDSNTTNYAQISLTAGVASTAGFAVADALNTYPAKSFAGFDIETASQLLTAGVLANATVSLYNNGTLVQTSSGQLLIVGATSSLLVPGTTRQVVGIVADTAYNEVKITFNQPVSASLGNIKIYCAVFERTCAPTILCSTAYYLKNPSFPVVIDNALTGVSGVATVDANVADAWNVITPDTTDFARITNNANVAANAAIAVLDPLTTYPKGTFAGFVIKPGSTPLVLANLLNSITVSTYNNGVLQEAHSGSSLISLTVLATIIGTPPSGAYQVGFYTTTTFDEIRISVASLVNAGLLNNTYIDVYGAFIDTRSSVSGTGTLSCMQAWPDVNAGLVKVTVPGNVSTNDVIPGGATYSALATPATAPSGSNATLTMNADGSYTFIGDKAGVYTYNVSYCLAGMTGGCPTEPLVITLTDPGSAVNAPVANTDLAVTSLNTSVVVNVRANDGPGNAGGTLGTPVITVAPGHGTASVNGAGNVVYVPAASFAGTDTLTYQVCESPAGTCATAQVIITTKGTGAPAAVVASDDYASVWGTNPVSGNVLTNDMSSTGNTLTATTQNISVPGKGTFVLNSNGTYTFTPVTGFYGTVNIPYTANDVAGGASAMASLHVVVEPLQANPDVNAGLLNQPIPGNVHTNDTVPPGTTYGPPAAVSVPPGSNPVITMNPDGSYSFTGDVPGVYVYNVPWCMPGAVPPCPVRSLEITVNNPASAANKPIVNDDITVTNAGVPVVVKVKANDGPGNAGDTLGAPTVTVLPQHGTTTVNPDGTVTYTPAAGFSGVDTFTYQVCEQPANTCGTARVTVTVNDAAAPPALRASDDYVMVQGTATATGNVLINDRSTTGDSLRATPQNLNIPGKGAFVLNSDGTYTFAAVNGFTGTVDIPYKANDTAGGISAGATLHIVVTGVPDLSPTISFLPASIVGTTNVNVVLTLYEFNGAATQGTITVYMLKDPKYVLSFSPATTILAGRPVQNSVWSFDAASNPLYYILTTSASVSAGGMRSVGFTTSFNPHAATGATNISAIILSGSGGETYDADNSDDDTLIYK